MLVTLVIAGVLGALALIVVLGAPYIEAGLLYHPWPERTAPEAAGLPGVREHVMRTPDGADVICWYLAAAPGAPTLLYFHGNGGTLAGRADRLSLFQERGYGFLIMAYRGYSGSTGRPSEAANVRDAKMAYGTLTDEFGVAAEDILIYGESIGTGVAIQVAADKPSAGVILDAPYTSIVDVAQLHYPLLPSRLLMRDRYETMSFLPRVTVPLLVLHGERDDVIPVEMGRAVAVAAPGASKLVTFPLAGHTDHYNYGSFNAITEWIGNLRRAQRRDIDEDRRSAG